MDHFGPNFWWSHLLIKALLQILPLEPYTCVLKDLGNRDCNRSAENRDDIEMNLDFRIMNSILRRFSISVLSCYCYILWSIAYAHK